MQPLAGNTSVEETQASQVPYRCTKYNLTNCHFVYRKVQSNLDLFWEILLHYNLWPLEKPLYKSCAMARFSVFQALFHTQTNTHTLMAEVVSCRWQWTEGHWWFLTLGVEAFSLWPVVSFCSSAVTYCTRLQHRSQQTRHHHVYHWLSISLGHYLSY